MNFELTVWMPRAAIEFARSELNSNIVERDAQQVFSREGWRKRAGLISAQLFGKWWNLQSTASELRSVNRRRPMKPPHK
jgi:hypothetical protein